MKIMTTSGGAAGRAAVCRTSFHPDAANREELILNLYPEERFQTFLGFGGAVTDSAAYVYSTLAPSSGPKSSGPATGRRGWAIRWPGAISTAATFRRSPTARTRWRMTRRLSTFR